MISRQIQTGQFEPHIGFYRTIAVAFFLITVALLVLTIFFASKNAVITIVAKEDPKNVNFSINIERERQSASSLSGVVTSTYFDWEEKYYPTVSKTKDGVATGEVVIYNKMNAAQPLVKTTRLLTSDNALFRLSSGVTVPPNGQITAKIYADQPGAPGNIGPAQFSIPGLSEAKQRLVYAESLEPAAGGAIKVGILTEEDLKTAKADYKDAVKKAFASYYTTDNQYFNYKLIAVDSQNVSSNHKEGDEIKDFALSGRNRVTLVMFSKDDLADLIEKEINKKINMTEEKIVSMRKDPVASVSSVDFKNGRAQISVNQEITVTLDADAEKLAPQNFMEKNKDEIEKYVLGLSHTAGVEIKFSPSWIRTSPSAPDKIKVVVKNVQ